MTAAKPTPAAAPVAVAAAVAAPVAVAAAPVAVAAAAPVAVADAAPVADADAAPVADADAAPVAVAAAAPVAAADAAPVAVAAAVAPTSPVLRLLRFLLSHHFESGLNRCVVIGGVHLCARCSTLYPLLGAVVVANALLRVPQEVVLDPLWIFLLPAPAFLDWRNGRYEPAQGSNAGRLLTGALAGLGLGRAVYIAARFPTDPRPWILFGALAIGAVLVERAASRYRAEVG